MGVTCTVTATGSRSAVIANRCLDRVADLEQLWSRFLDHSDVSRRNNADGRPLWVDDRTIVLLHHMIEAHRLTGGAFNPALLPLQMSAGDSRSLVDNGRTVIPDDARATADISAVEFLPDGRVRLPDGLTVDAGGIAKGHAADLVASWARAEGADGVCINIGGDMAIDSGDESGWNIDILSPLTGDTTTTVHVARGGVATSAINARHRNGGIASHIFTTEGAVADDRVIGASVIASTAGWAEVWTKAAIVSEIESAFAALEAHGLAAMVQSADGSVSTTSTWSSFVR